MNYCKINLDNKKAMIYETSLGYKVNPKISTM